MAKISVQSVKQLRYLALVVLLLDLIIKRLNIHANVIFTRQKKINSYKPVFFSPPDICADAPYHQDCLIVLYVF